MSRTNTNMASEFWFFSQLHRLGYETFITLGNTKGIDIVIRLSDKKLLTFDVKGKETFQHGHYLYLPSPPYNDNHFFVFIGLQVRREKDSKIIIDGDPLCFIVEANDLNKIALPWVSSKGTKGFGIHPKILSYLRGDDPSQVGLSEKSLNHFKKGHKLKDINFKYYKQIIMALQDFEDKFHTMK